jgi:hypothetical protein
MNLAGVNIVDHGLGLQGERQVRISQRGLVGSRLNIAT